MRYNVQSSSWGPRATVQVLGSHAWPVAATWDCVQGRRKFCGTALHKMAESLSGNGRPLWPGWDGACFSLGVMVKNRGVHDCSDQRPLSPHPEEGSEAERDQGTPPPPTCPGAQLSCSEPVATARGFLRPPGEVKLKQAHPLPALWSPLCSALSLKSVHHSREEVTVPPSGEDPQLLPAHEECVRSSR
uniref:Uncharacterized protein n=1 Tax=Molossus molossus TaxID=27622 RepID=A0A7J8I981_MOLMO|nr:hypothetical protein HJG59_010498 [Molossus molossus]